MKIIINGLGRIGKLVFRRLCDENLHKNILMVNEKAGSASDQEYFLRYDTVHGTWGDDLCFKNGCLKRLPPMIGLCSIPFLSNSFFKNCEISFFLHNIGKQKLLTRSSYSGTTKFLE